jgi:hypothetical protein
MSTQIMKTHIRNSIMRWLCFTAGLNLFAVTHSFAQVPCTLGDALPEALSDIAAKSATSVLAGHDLKSAPPLMLQTVTQINLHPQAHVALSVQQKTADKPDSFGGYIRFKISEPATYGIAASDSLWFEVITRSGPIASSRHRHGCGDVAKIVYFPLTAGDYVLQLNKAKAATVTISIFADED